MDKKLQEYRARKHREQLVTNTIEGLKERWHNVFGLRSRQEHPNHSNLHDDEINQPLLATNKEDEAVELPVLPDEEIDKISCCTSKAIFTYTTIFLIWVSFYWLFIKWGFGSVYFVISALLGMYFNTSTKKKQKGEVSAYSVFNKDCESIKGAVKAEDLERQMIYGQLF